jgi:hypothetical protein
MKRGFGYSGLYGRMVIALLLVLAALAAPVWIHPTAAQEVQTRVQFLHAGPNVGKVEMFINGDKKVDNFNYGDTSDWINLDPGSVELRINEDRRGTNWAIFDAVYPVPAGNDYYIVVTDELVIGGAIDRSPITDGTARVKIVHASVDLPTVNVVATGSDVKFASQLTYPRSSDAVPVPAGTYDIVVNQADTGAELFTVSGVELQGNMVYQLVILGDPSDSDHPMTITSLVDDTATRAPSTPASV